MSLQPTMASIRDGTPRAEDWKRVFGDRWVPIMGPMAVTMDLGDGPKRYLKVAVKSLSKEQRARIVEHISSKFDISPDEVNEGLDSDYGLPILEDDVTISMDMRHFL